MSADISNQLKDQVLEAGRTPQPLIIHGGNTKSFYGRPVQGDVVSVAAHSGIISYQPTELVITARAGTPIAELQMDLEKNGQMLGFDPPRFADGGTLGGAIAAGLAGPSRPFQGAVQDFVLGAKILTGDGKIMQFGGQVIKNVAGFDVSRLMVGALGCLGIILEVSLKVSPIAQSVKTAVLDVPSADNAIDIMNNLAGKPLPISAASWYEGKCRIRLSGSEQGVDAAMKEIGGDSDDQGDSFWDSVRDQTHDFFKQNAPLLRCSLPPAAPGQKMIEKQLIDWGGAQRWCYDVGGTGLVEEVENLSGHVTRFKNGGDDSEVFSELNPAIMKIRKRLKNQFDPLGILNPGRMYEDF